MFNVICMCRSSAPQLQAPVVIRPRPPMRPAAPQPDTEPRAWPSALGPTDTAHTGPCTSCLARGQLQLARTGICGPGQNTDLANGGTNTGSTAEEGRLRPARWQPREGAPEQQPGWPIYSSKAQEQDTHSCCVQQRDKAENTTAQESRTQRLVSYRVSCL